MKNERINSKKVVRQDQWCKQSPFAVFRNWIITQNLRKHVSKYLSEGLMIDAGSAGLIIDDVFSFISYNSFNESINK